MQHSIHVYEALHSSGAYKLAVEGWNHLVQNDLIPDGVIPFTMADPCIVAFDENTAEPIGIIVYREEISTRSAYVCLGYVEPASAEMGVYTAMYGRLKAHLLSSRAVVRIVGETSVNNEPMLNLMKKLGRKQRSITFVEEL